MTQINIEMVDVVFELSGGTLPAAYPYALWDELTKLVPELEQNEYIGVVPLRLSEGPEGMQIPKRAKLALRLPNELAAIVTALSQKQMRVAGNMLQLGTSKMRPIQPYSTLHAQLVTGADDEVDFMAEIEAELAALGVKASLICGQRRTLTDGKNTIRGYSLVLHDLMPEHSLLVQYAGLGKERRFGCGIFVPYKVISSFE